MATIKAPQLYTVSGRGRFPLDMLRYDSAWPASSTDSATISATLTVHRGSAAVQLLSHKSPTADRWTSFGWTVID